MMAPIVPDDFMSFMTFLGLDDKHEHAIAFFILSFLLNRASHTKIHRLRNIMVLLIFGIAIELIQIFIPERSAGFDDVLANFIGILIFQLSFSIYLYFRKRKKSYN